jgi:predicted MPP superfamily phosphohydrolase
MPSLSRRTFLSGAAVLGASTLGLSTYAVAIEQGIRLDVTSYGLTPPQWPDGLALRIGVIADIHACEPWMPVRRIEQIVAVTNSLRPDLIVILGDFTAGHSFVTGPVMPEQWGAALSALRAPLGLYAVLGNHDWWHGPLVGSKSDDAESVRVTLRQAGIVVLENDGVRLAQDGRPFWLLGLADQLAFACRRGQIRGADDLYKTLAHANDDAPVILLAHEPYVFRRVPDRVALTLCGHTHGGQVNLPIIGPRIAASGHRSTRYTYGHIVEGGRNLIISAGLGASVAPIRFMRPPEIVDIALGATATRLPDRASGRLARF